MNIPSNWKNTTIGAICETTSGGTPDRDREDYYGGNISWLKSGELEDGRITQAEESISQTGLENSSAKIIPKDTLLIALYGATAGKVGVLKFESAVNQAICAITTPQNLRDDFLFYYLIYFRNDLRAKRSGGAQLNLSQGKIKSTTIPLPPLGEQQRIVAKIEELFSKLDSGISELEEAKAQANGYRKAILEQAIWGVLTGNWRQENPKLANPRELIMNPSEYSPPDGSDLPDIPEDWILATFGDVFEVYLGSTPKRSNDEYWGGDIHWISSGEVEFSRIKDSEETITQAGLESCSTTLHPPNTVLLGIIGQGKTRGRAAILDIEAAHNQNTVAIRPKEAGISAKYIYYFFMENYERTRRLGSGNQQKALSKTRVQNMVFPLPPVEEQNRIADILDQNLSIIEKIEQSVETNIERASRLRQSILKHAFEGNLVPQEPTEDPRTPDGGDTKLEPGEQATLSEVISNVE